MGIIRKHGRSLQRKSDFGQGQKQANCQAEPRQGREEEMTKEKTYSVYCHTLKEDGRKYFGITCQKPEYRWNGGRGYLNHSYHSHFSNAIKLYGWDAFNHEILYTGLSQEEARQKEIELIAEFNTRDRRYGFNTLIGGDTGMRGIKQSQESIEKRRKSNTGKKRTEETKRKISEWHKNPPQSYRDSLSKAFKGRTVNEETRKKISEATKKAMQNPSVREKVIAANRRKAAKFDNRRIYNIDLNRYYQNRRTACDILGIDISNLTRCLNGCTKTCGGYEWKWAD